MNETNKKYILWIEDNQELIESRLGKLEALAGQFGYGAVVKNNLANALEFMENSHERVGLVILDLDIPETTDEPAGKPVGLEVLAEYGHLPFIVFTANEHMVKEKEQALTPLAWVTKDGDNPNRIFEMLEEALKYTDIQRLGEKDRNDPLRTLACIHFHMQSFTKTQANPSNPVPWEVLGLKRGIDLVEQCLSEQGGRRISVSGANVFFECPVEKEDPDHFRSALNAAICSYQTAFGKQGEHGEFGHWYVPPFSVALLPNHVNLIEHLTGAPYPALHALGRPGEIVRFLAERIEPGKMAVIEDWMDSKAVGVWESFATAEHVIQTLEIPYLHEVVRVLIKAMPPLFK